MPTNKPGYMKAYRQLHSSEHQYPLCSCGKRLQGKLSKERLTCSHCWKKTEQGKAETKAAVKKHRNRSK